MKTKLNKIFCLFIAFIISFSIALPPKNTIKAENLPVQLGAEKAFDQTQVAKYEKVAENEHLTLFADEKGFIAVRNNKSGYIWYSHPNDTLTDKKTVGLNKQNFQSEIVVRYIFKDENGETSSYNEAAVNSQSAVRSGWVKSEKTENGVKVTYDFFTISARIVVEYCIDGENLKARLIGKEILERDKFKKAVEKTATPDELEVMQDSFITSVWLLPSFGAGNEKEKGFVFVPDGSGAYMDFKAVSHSTDIANIPVYGSEPAIDEYKAETDEKFSSVTNEVKAYMPFFGAAKGKNGFTAVITNGDAISSINAFKAGTGNGYTGVSAQIDYRRVTFTRIANRLVQGFSELFADFDDFEISYSFLSGENVSFAGFAQNYREYLLKSNQLKQNRFKPSLALKTVGAIDVAGHFLGFPCKKIKALTTFEQASRILKELKEKNVDNIALNYVGWSNNGVQNKKITKNAKPLKALGGKKALNKFACDCDTLYLDADLITFKKSGNGISKNSDSIKTVFDKPALTRKFSYATFDYESGGIRIVSSKSLNKLFGRYLKSVNRLNRNAGVSFNSISGICYSDFGSESKSSRNETVKAYKNELKGVKRNLCAEDANAYMFSFAERIYNAPNTSSRQKIYDGEIPFYSMVIHGFIAVTSPVLNQCASERKAFLRAVETGSELMYTVMYEDSGAVNGTEYDYLYGSTFGMLKEDIAKNYAEYKDLLTLIGDKTVVNYVILANGVSQTVYENGISVFVNYTNEDYITKDGVKIPSLGFIKGEEKQ